MRYSQIIGDAFFQIRLSPSQYRLVDAHFLASSHHLKRLEQCQNRDHYTFHHLLFYRHLRALVAVIAKGDFSKALDLSGNNLDLPQNWDPTHRFPLNLAEAPNPVFEKGLFPDAEQYDLMSPDSRFTLGQHHFYDVILDNPNISPIQIISDVVHA